uniref:Carbohydrate kinase PfkB domain-containing protein n=1 Tax=Sphenodon punctatus TaxID=8508 RepID=A0A8D0GI40_SPHPU
NDWEASLHLRTSHGCCGDIKVHPYVKEALANGRPVVVLESTIITHGMPYPQNLSMAKEVEEIVRLNGSVSATVGILKGRIHVGLKNEELEFLAKSKHLVKVSRRDLPYVLSKGLSGGTTVSGTMLVAHKMGIPVFVTGGIGGVHRGGEKTMDVSADLTELGRTPVAVVSAGVKSILDIGRTLEYLETQGVCVASFGNSREFPAFFSHQSGFQAPYQVQNEEEAAKLIASTLTLGLSSGVLIAVPCPKEQAASGETIEKAIQQAVNEAGAKGIIGKELTPFLLQRVNELTHGKSLDSSILLLKKEKRYNPPSHPNLIQYTDKAHHDLRHLFPAALTSGLCSYYLFLQSGGQTNPGKVSQTFGGVGRNLAGIYRLGKMPLFISAMGKDEHSESILRYCSHMDMGGVVQLDGHSTATYCAVITGSGELSLGLGDMDIHQQITEQYISKFKQSLCTAPLVCVDGNVSTSTIQYVCQIAREHHIAVCYEPTDENKASKPFLSDSWRSLTCISPNLRELRAINRTLGHPIPADLPSRMEDVVSAAMALVRPLLKQLHCVVVTLGPHGVLLCGRLVGGSVSLCPGAHKQVELCAVHYPALPLAREEIVNVSGAGDSLIAGIMAGLLAGQNTDTCVQMGLLSASFSLRSSEPISPEITAISVSPEQVKAQSWPKAKTWQLD